MIGVNGLDECNCVKGKGEGITFPAGGGGSCSARALLVICSVICPPLGHPHLKPKALTNAGKQYEAEFALLFL